MRRKEDSVLEADDSTEVDLEAAPDSVASKEHHRVLTATPASEEDVYHRHPNRRRCCARYGRTHVIYSCTSDYGYFPATAHVGPHWPCMLLTYAIAIGPMFLVFFKDNFIRGFRVALVLTSVVTTISFTLVACSDPGVVFESYEPLPQLQQSGDEEDTGGVFCAQCHVRRPKTASHCSDCGVCVDQLDHHCPWTGKCIGKRTLWLFYVFLVSISVHIVLLSVGTTITFLTR